MKLKIDRSKWLRGGPGRLLDEAGMMCCLGFLGKACGINKADMLHVGQPSEISSEPRRNKAVWERLRTERPLPGKALVALAPEPFEPEPSCYGELPLIWINDNGKITEKRREKLLTEEFAKIGVEVEFT